MKTQAATTEGGIAPKGHVCASYEFTSSGSQSPPGDKLIFVKASLTPDMPPRFPNHPTTHQLFNSDEFEAYRALGAWLTKGPLLDAIDIKSNDVNRLSSREPLDHDADV